MPYTLFNIKDNKQLKRSTAGEEWATDSKQEAEEALQDLYDYLAAVGMSHMKENFAVVQVT